ncbi:hypothetical protein [Streptomyces sp. NPDC056227]|uniref:hypothetical protein n=1 Tax=Streptomyces sp. NPDC056227 TaxID=3345753 RepID=UPI0035DA6262
MGEIEVQPRQRQLGEAEGPRATILSHKAHHRTAALLRHLDHRRRLIRSGRHRRPTPAARPAHAATPDCSRQPSSLNPGASHAPSGTSSIRVRISSSCKVCRYIAVVDADR